MRLLFTHFVLAYTYCTVRCTAHLCQSLTLNTKIIEKSVERKDDLWVVKRLICKSSWMLWSSYWNSIPDIILCRQFSKHVNVWAVKLIPLELRKQNRYQRQAKKCLECHKFLLWKEKSDGKSDPSDSRCVYSVHNAKKRHEQHFWLLKIYHLNRNIEVVHQRCLHWLLCVAIDVHCQNDNVMQCRITQKYGRNVKSKIQIYLLRDWVPSTDRVHLWYLRNEKKKMISNQAPELIRVPMTVWILLHYFCINFLFVRTAQVESPKSKRTSSKVWTCTCAKANMKPTKFPMVLRSDRLCIAHQRNTIETFLHNVVVVVFHFTSFFFLFDSALPLSSGSSYYISYSFHYYFLSITFYMI